jgi:chorismate mutase
MMHPYFLQMLATERIGDMHTRAAMAQPVADSRRNRRRPRRLDLEACRPRVTEEADQGPAASDGSIYEPTQMPDSQSTIYAGRTENAVTIGRIDELIDQIFKRLAMAEQVAAAKFAIGKPIADPMREQQVVDSVAHALCGAGPFKEAVMQFFRDQILANKLIQGALHRRWHAHPEEIPAAYADMDQQIRPKVDRITMRMLWQIVVMNELPDLRHHHMQTLLENKLASEPFVRKLNQLDRDATFIALRSFMGGRRPNSPTTP